MPDQRDDQCNTHTPLSILLLAPHLRRHRSQDVSAKMLDREVDSKVQIFRQSEVRRVPDGQCIQLNEISGREMETRDERVRITRI